MILREVAGLTATPGGIFYDLGSGTGKAVYVVRSLPVVGRCCISGRRDDDGR